MQFIGNLFGFQIHVIYMEYYSFEFNSINKTYVTISTKFTLVFAAKTCSFLRIPPQIYTDILQLPIFILRRPVVLPCIFYSFLLPLL